MSNTGYDGREPDSQVRSIIKQLNEERPSKEKSREVVVRPDGTKVIRVVKKRKVMISGEEKARKAKRRFMFSLLGVFIAGALLTAFFFVRMAMMSSDSYVQERQEEIRESWGAKSVRLLGARVDGFSFTAERMVVEFPDTSVLQSVELKNISAVLDGATYFRGIPMGDELKIDSAVVRVRATADKLQMPAGAGKELWKFKRVSCNDLTVEVGDGVESPFSIRKTQAYVSESVGGGGFLVLLMEGGQLNLQGWKPANLTTGKVLLSHSALEDFTISGSISGPKTAVGTQESKFIISGKIEEGKPLAGPYRFLCNNMSLGMITENAFSSIFTGFINDKLSSDTVVDSYVTLPFGGSQTHFFGKFTLSEAEVRGMKALAVVNEHASPGRSRSKNSPVPVRDLAMKFRDVTVELAYDMESHKRILTLPVMVNMDLHSVEGSLTVDSQGAISGNLNYGITLEVARSEYTDEDGGHFIDPIFTDPGRDDYVWFMTTVSGTSKEPVDNADELDQQAEAGREGHKRIDMVGGVSTPSTPVPAPAKESAKDSADTPASGTGLDTTGLDGSTDTTVTPPAIETPGQITPLPLPTDSIQPAESTDEADDSSSDGLRSLNDFYDTLTPGRN